MSTISPAPNISLSTVPDSNPLSITGSINGLPFSPVTLRTMTSQYSKDKGKDGETKSKFTNGVFTSAEIALNEILFSGSLNDPESLGDLAQVLFHEAVHAWLAENASAFAKNPAGKACRDLVIDALVASELCAAANDCDAPLNEIDRAALVGAANDANARCAEQSENGACAPQTCPETSPLPTTCPGPCEGGC